MARFLFKFWLFTPHSFRCFVCYKLFCCHELKFSHKTFTVHRATWEIENIYIYIWRTKLMRNRPKTAKVMCSDCTYLFVELVYTYLYWHCKLEMAVHSALCCYKWHCHCGSNPRICCGSIYFFFLFFSLYPQVNWMCQPCSDWVWIKHAVYFCAYWETIYMTDLASFFTF